LDTALDRGPEPTRIRFQALLAQAPAAGWLAASRDWDYESWADDLDRVVVSLSRQDFRAASPLIGRWLAQYPLQRELDDRGAYLRARTLVLHGDTRRDQGMLAGPGSAAHAYRQARGLFADLDIPRRIAQIELSLAVVTEMTGQHQEAARQYVQLADDERLSARDRARSRLWIGTAVSKAGEHDYALRVMTTASREFEDLDEAEDWAVAQQKLALACRGAGRLGDALRYIDTARASGTAATPMQRVRLATAHAHILLTDTATATNGHALLRGCPARRRERLVPPAPGHRGDPSGQRRPGPRQEGNHHVMISDADRQDAQLIWDYHQMGHDPRPCDAGIGLGSHDLGVATLAADLYHASLFPVLVFTGANSPTTLDRFPRGEAVHYAEQAMALGVPQHAIIIEPEATNTGQNITCARQALADAGISPGSVMLVSKPYMQRRAYATARKLWPEVSIVCVSEDLSLDDYLKQMGDGKLVLDMLVGDLQRVIEYPARGFAISQEVPAEVDDAYRRLIAAGFDSRLTGS
jgi:uncharacterized SAM-binding protein YcdF (DUF218 family)